MSDLFDRAYHCEVCGENFDSKQVRTSAIRTKSRMKDFHATFHGENPTYYGVICCPSCGYAQFESDFKKKVTDTDRDKIQLVISTNWKTQDFTKERSVEDAIRVHTIAIASYKLKNAPASTMAKLYLRLAWFYRENELFADSKKYMRLALDAFIDSYENEKLDEMSGKELETIYLIGELNRQLGNFSEAVRWFDQTVRHEFAYKNRLIVTYAREQWALAVEQHNDNR